MDPQEMEEAACLCDDAAFHASATDREKRAKYFRLAAEALRSVQPSERSEPAEASASIEAAARIPKGMKPVYVKRWRTLIFVGESIADEVVEALRPQSPATASFDATARMRTILQNIQAMALKGFNSDDDSTALSDINNFCITALAAPQPTARADREVLKPFGRLADFFDNYEAKPGEETVLVAVKLSDLRAARAALATQQPNTSGEREAVADQMIGQIEDRFPNWRSFRDLIDCIDCTLHDLRKDAALAAEPEREFAADMNPVDDAEFGMKP